MDLLVMGFVGLIFMCVLAGSNFYATAKMQEKIQASKQARRELNKEIHQLQATLISKREEKKLAISKLRMAKSESQMQEEVSLDMSPSSPRSAAGQFEEELVSQKVITPRELERVKNYRKSTSCPFNLAETVVMLGYATQQEIDRVKAKYPNGM